MIPLGCLVLGLVVGWVLATWRANRRLARIRQAIQLQPDQLAEEVVANLSTWEPEEQP